MAVGYKTEGNVKMEGDWLFSRKAIMNSPNMQFFRDEESESLFRLHTMNFQHLIGDKLKLSRHCICIANVFLHRFNMFVSKEEARAKKVSAVALFLSGKAHNEFRRIEQVVKCYDYLLTRRKMPLEVNSKEYQDLKDEFLIIESLLLLVLGIQVNVELPHLHVITICQKTKGSIDEMTKLAYFLATTSIMATTMCLQYRPIVVACACINLASRYTGIKMEPSDNGKPWFKARLRSFSQEKLDDLGDELESGILRGAQLDVKAPDLEHVLTYAVRADNARKLAPKKDERPTQVFVTPPMHPLPKPTERCSFAREIKVQIPRSYLVLK